MKIPQDDLKIIALDKINKTKDAFEESILLSSALKIISNLIYGFERMKSSELAQCIYSLNHWINSRSYITTKKYKPGSIVEIELGLNYHSEISYRHLGVVLEDLNKKVVIVPVTSSTFCIDNSSEKVNGQWYYRLTGRSEGFDRDECILVLNDLKSVNKGRIIAKLGNMTDFETGKVLFDDIKMEILKKYFSKQCSEYESTISNLKKENEFLQSQITEMSDIIDSLKLENKEHQITIKEKTQTINRYCWLLHTKTDYYKKIS